MTRAFLPLWRIRPMARGWAPPGSNPTMHCTSEREQPRGIKGTGPSVRRAAGYSTAHKKTRARLPSTPLRLHFCLSGRASSLIQPSSAPVSLLLSTPMLLNRVILITKETLSGGGGKYLGVYYHTHINMLILSFLKKEKNS